MKLLKRSFYARDTVTVARDLLGKILVRNTAEGTVSGMITETEAYGASDDPASHAFRGMTKRNAAMFGEVGRAYVYFTYGMHHCLNAVARDDTAEAGAVLVRAIRPLRGAETMMRNRKRDRAAGLADGPAKLAQAMEISRDQYGMDLTRRADLFIADGTDEAIRVLAGPRIGIRHGTEKQWNFRLA